MEGILKNSKILSNEKADPAALEEYRRILADLEYLKKQIQQVDTNFNMAVDEDLVESYIYELNALSARLRYVMREAKEQKNRLAGLEVAGMM